MAISCFTDKLVQPAQSDLQAALGSATRSGSAW